MIATPYLELKSNREEVLPGYTEEFPYVCMFRRMDECIGRKIAWHWHSALEIDYVEEGEIEYKVPEGSVTAQGGSCFYQFRHPSHRERKEQGRQDICPSV